MPVGSMSARRRRYRTEHAYVFVFVGWSTTFSYLYTMKLFSLAHFLREFLFSLDSPPPFSLPSSQLCVHSFSRFFSSFTSHSRFLLPTPPTPSSYPLSLVPTFSLLLFSSVISLLLRYFSSFSSSPSPTYSYTHTNTLAFLVHSRPF